MISEGSCDTKVMMLKIQLYITTYIQIENSYFKISIVSQYYYFYGIFWSKKYSLGEY